MQCHPPLAASLRHLLAALVAVPLVAPVVQQVRLQQLRHVPHLHLMQNQQQGHLSQHQLHRHKPSQHGVREARP